jgi:hypothetical protein
VGDLEHVARTEGAPEAITQSWPNAQRMSRSRISGLRVIPRLLSRLMRPAPTG